MSSDKKCYAFYELTKTTLEGMAKKRNINISELQKYYFQTDQYMNFYKSLNGIARVFAQMLFHVQNATMISNIVKFESKYDFLKKITKDFNPKLFLEAYSGPQRIENLVDDLRYNGKSNPDGLVWDSSKSSKKDAIAIRFAKAMFECAEYLEGFKTDIDVLNDLKNNYKAGNKLTPAESLIKYFRSKIKSGFSVALTCDFLKEFSPDFDLPKPDIHIKDVIFAFNGNGAQPYNTESRELKLIGEMQDITGKINKELDRRGEKAITVYQLDRMIWLVCTNNFFLHSDAYKKDKYISNIKKIKP